MYKVTINSTVKEIAAEGISIENGNILFYSDTAKGLVTTIISSGRWDALEIMGDSEPLQVRGNTTTEATATTETTTATETTTDETTVETTEATTADEMNEQLAGV